jgi:hypothetical protein
VPKHEQYEELSALAMIGEASAAELKNLKDHLEHCPDCRQEYFEFVQFVLPQLSLAADLQPIQELKREDREAIRSNFLAQAARSGVRFSAEALAGPTSSAMSRKSLPSPAFWFRYGLSVGLAVFLVAGSFFLGRRAIPTMPTRRPNMSQTGSIPPQTKVQVDSTAAPNLPVVETPNAELRKMLDETIASLAKIKAALKASAVERAQLQARVAQQNIRLGEVEQDRESLDEARASLQVRLEELQQKESVLEADYAREVAAVVELTEKLSEQKMAVEQQREWALTDSEVRDLMASRNLHIVDVFDTDSHGKRKPIFGRVFFAENKQLVFYAYDLNEERGHGKKINYHVWGQKEGPGQAAKSLGTFHPDDKAQHRWIFKSDDQKILSEIDSIFVTVEKSDSPKGEPSGVKLMYAYLRDRPNHP